MQNDECKMKVFPSEMIIICPQSRHHNSAFSILHFNSPLPDYFVSSNNFGMA